MNKIDNIIENKVFIVVLLVIMFLISGINKIFNFGGTVESLRQKVNYDMSNYIYNLIIVVVILVEIIAPIIIIYYFVTRTYKMVAYYSVIALVVFTILATLLYHFPDFSNYKRSLAFWANISLLGGLLLLAKVIKE